MPASSPEGSSVTSGSPRPRRIPRSRDGSGTASWPWPPRTATTSSLPADATPRTATWARRPAASTQQSSPITDFTRWPWTRPAGWGVAGGASPGRWHGRRPPSTISPTPSRPGTCGLRSRRSATSGITGTHGSGRACNAKSPWTRPWRYGNSSGRRGSCPGASSTTACTPRSRPARAGFRGSPSATCWPECFTTGTTPTASPSREAGSSSATDSSSRALARNSPLRLSARASTTSRSPTGLECRAAVCAGRPSTSGSDHPPGPPPRIPS